MKVILNEDVKHLGEEGDVKNVATGYARNYLLPRNLVVPYNEATAAYFESKKAEIEARKDVKRANARTLKEKLEGTTFEISMPAAANGKLYAAVTTSVIAETLLKAGFEIERKRIELQGIAIKTVGTYKAVIKLYESQSAEITVAVKPQEDVSETKKAEPKKSTKSSQEVKTENKEDAVEEKAE